MPGPTYPITRSRSPFVDRYQLEEIDAALAQATNRVHGPGYSGSAGTFTLAPEWVYILGVVTGNDGGSPPAHSWTESIDDPENQGSFFDKDDGTLGTVSPENLPLYDINGATLVTNRRYYVWKGVGDYFLTDGATLAESVVVPPGGISYTGTSPVTFDAPLEVCGRLYYCHTTASNLTTTYNNYPLPTPDAPYYNFPATSTSTITGMDPGDSTKGRTIVITNTGTANITFNHEDTNSSASNRIYTFTQGPYVLPPGMSLLTIYDPSISRWRIVGSPTPPDATITSSTPGTNQNDVTITTSFNRWAPTANITFTGIVPRWPNDVVTFTNTSSSYSITLKNDATSSAANRFYTFTGGDVVINPGETFTFVYDATSSRWRMVSTTGVTSALSTGLSGGRTITGGTGSGDTLTLDGTSHATEGGIVLASGNWLTVPEVSAPSTPASGKVAIYAKSDGKLYIKDDAGTETDLTATGGVSGDQAVLSSDYTVTSGYASTGLTISLPSAGTYYVQAEVTGVFSVTMAAGGEILCRLYNSTTSTAYGDSEKALVSAIVTGLAIRGSCVCAAKITTTGAETIRLEAKYNATGSVSTATIFGTGGSYGATNIRYIK